MHALDQQTGQRSDEDDRHRPCREQQTGIDLAAPANRLQEKRQRHHSQHLCGERADRRGDRHGEYGNPKQIDRKKRIGPMQLATNEKVSENERRNGSGHDMPRIQPVRISFDRGDQQSERPCVHHGARPVELTPVRLYRIARKEAPAQQDGQQAERQIDGEKPWPRSDRQHAGGHGGPGSRRNGDDQRVDTHVPAEVTTGINDPDQRRIDARHGRSAESLHRARHRKLRERPRQHASQRGKRENDQAAEINLPITDQIAQRRKRQQRDDDRQLVGIDDPNRRSR